MPAPTADAAVTLIAMVTLEYVVGDSKVEWCELGFEYGM